MPFGPLIIRSQNVLMVLIWAPNVCQYRRKINYDQHMNTIAIPARSTTQHIFYLNMPDLVKFFCIYVPQLKNN